ncbi:MAG: hypothetical protein NT159_16410 [Proteobacteria bacterium]|nr:hypothetical protein [Pseudomonadota bacterium]
MHELSHYGKALEQAQLQHKHLPESNSCEKCVVFAHIAGVVHSQAPQLVTLSLGYDHTQPLQVASIAAEIPSPHNRGPPLFL